MLIATADEITGDADIQRAIAAVRHCINKAAFHRSHREDVDARHKAGHDGGEACAQKHRPPSRGLSSVMAGLVPAISLNVAPHPRLSGITGTSPVMTVKEFV
jgi:hypothetical protein